MRQNLSSCSLARPQNPLCAKSGHCSFCQKTSGKATHHIQVAGFVCESLQWKAYESLPLRCNEHLTHIQCSLQYCRLYQGNAIQVAMEEGNTVCFLLAGNSVTKIDLDASRICLFLGYRGETVTLQYNKVEEPAFSALLEAEARDASRMIIRVDYKTKLCEVSCGKVTLKCDILQTTLNMSVF